MSPLNPLFALIVMTIAGITGYFLSLRTKIVNQTNKFETIDGLRGFLAISVFIHHSTIWYQYKEEGVWRLPDSNLYIHLGETSVALFFMITSFLFVSKIINTEDEKFKWEELFISRFFRIIPMYFFSLITIIILVMQISHWKLNVDPLTFVKSIFDWLFFTITDTTDINKYSSTDKINAGVTWSLAYEWLFYFSLPVIALFISYKKTKALFLFISVTFIIFFCFHQVIQPYNLYAFIGGAIASLLSKFVSIDSKLKNHIVSIIVVLCLLFIRQFSSAKNEYCMILITIVFTLIANGASLFGILKIPVVKFLGNISYSTYLLHGIVLFITFHFIISTEELKLCSPSKFSVVIFVLTPIVIMISYLGYRFIENPFIKKSKEIVKNYNSKNVH